MPSRNPDARSRGTLPLFNGIEVEVATCPQQDAG